MIEFRWDGFGTNGPLCCRLVSETGELVPVKQVRPNGTFNYCYANGLEYAGDRSLDQLHEILTIGTEHVRGLGFEHEYQVVTLAIPAGEEEDFQLFINTYGQRIPKLTVLSTEPIHWKFPE